VRSAHAPAARAFCVAFLAVFVLLGVMWGMDRTHRWATPRLEASFVPVRGEPPGRVTSRATWLMPIHPGCPSCMERARALSGEATSARVVFLVVDRSQPPPLLALSELEAATIWWDSRGVWRHQWGHRVYGEILRFDSRGRYEETKPPDSAPVEGGEGE